MSGAPGLTREWAQEWAQAWAANGQQQRALAAQHARLHAPRTPRGGSDPIARSDDEELDDIDENGDGRGGHAEQLEAERRQVSPQLRPTYVLPANPNKYRLKL